MTGIILMSAFLMFVAILGGSALVLSRLLPAAHPVRQRLEAAAAWIQRNPRLFEKRLKQVAFGILVLIFTVLTVLYS